MRVRGLRRTLGNQYLRTSRGGGAREKKTQARNGGEGSLAAAMSGRPGLGRHKGE